jgi:TonB-dependent receptor
MSKSKSFRVLWRSMLMFGASVFAAEGALAQDTQRSSEAEATASENEIVVVGSIVSSQGAAINEKRNADNIIDVVSADAVGRFPDQNSAAALSRLPAVAVQRDQGQERYVQIRGAPNRYVSVTVDGVPVIGVDEGGSTRAFRFDAVPSVLLSSAAVSKSLTPDLSAEAVISNVDLRTYSPMAADGLEIQGDVGLGQMELGGGEQRQGSLRAAWANDRFGIVIGGSHYRREQVTDNREVGAYNGRVPTELDIRNYQLIRENNGLFFGAEFRATPALTLSAKAIYTEFLDTEDRDQYEFRLDRAPGFATSGRGGDLVNVPVRATYNEGDYATRYHIYTLGADYQKDAWEISGRLNLTESENTTFLPLVQMSTSSAQNVSLNYNFDNPNFPIVRLFTTVPGTPPTRGTPLTALDQTAFASINYIAGRQDSFSDSVTAKLDVAHTDENATVRAGLFYADRSLDGFTFAFSNGAVLTGRINPANYATGAAWSTGFPLGIRFTEVNNARLRADVLAAAIGAPSFVPGQTYSPANDVPATNRYDISEELLAGYASAEVEFEGGQLVFGLRVENFSSVNKGTAQIGANTFVPLTFKQDYTDLFPSANLRLDLRDDVVLRLGAQRSIARPTFGEVRIGAAINDTSSPGTVSGGNPALKPEYITGVDGALEWYPSRNSILAVSAFHRAVQNVLYANTEGVGSDAFDSNGVDRSNYLLTSTFNGEEGTLTGIEFNYQQQFTFLPGALSGLGFQGNLTFLDGSFDTAQRQGIAFPGTSERIVNASLYYEKFGFSGRVSYQWRDDWLDTLGGLGVGSTGDEFRRAYENVDVTLRYELTDKLTLYADLANLTDETYVAFLGDEGRPTEVEQIGSRYLFGLRFQF